MKQVMLGVLCALLCAAAVTLGTREQEQGALAVADNVGALEEVVLHYDPRALGAVAETYEDLLRELPSSVEVAVVVEKEEDFVGFREQLARWGTANIERFRAVVVGKRITTWSRDRYLLLQSAAGRAQLLVPPRPTESNPARHNDWLAPFALAKTIESVDTQIAELLFEGGDFTVTDTHIFATALLAERNRGGDLRDRDALKSWLRRHTGKTPIILGRTLQEVPEHHIGMFVTPLDDKHVLVGDPTLGLSLFDASKTSEGDLPRAVERDPIQLQRFETIAAELREQGFTVVRIPLVPLVDGLTYLTFNNALLEERDGVQHVYLPQFGIPALDEGGAQVYRDAGFVIHPIRVKKIYEHNGTVRCLLNVLRRSR